MATGVFPIYTSREQLDGRTALVQPLAQPNLPSGASVTAAGSDVSRALLRAGEEVADFGAKLLESQDETRALQARTGYLTRLNELREKYENDPDYQTAPQRFEQDRLEAARDNLASIRDARRRASAEMNMTVEGLSAQRHVKNKAVASETDVNNANLDTLETQSLKAASNAITPLERGDALARHTEAVQAAAKAGWISETAAVARIKRFAVALDTAEVTRAIRDDPVKAAAMLDDPKNFPNIEPVQREQWRNHARHAADNRTSQDVVAGAPFNPAGAIATAGRLTDPGQARVIFERGIIPAEGGKAADGTSLVSPKGAVGLTQIMPDTARDVARQLGLADVAALDDAALTQRLKADDKLNFLLGSTYWSQQARRYSGNIPVMMAAYNAGPGKADEWLKTATEKFGPDFTAAQFMSVVSYKETRDYIARAYQKLGGEPSAGGMSPDARFRTAQQVGARLNAEETERVRGIKDIATSERLMQDPAALYGAGMTPDPTVEALFVARNLEAARNGDAAATKALIELAEKKRLFPLVRQAYATAPAELDQKIAAEEARLANTPNASLQEKNTLDAMRAVRDEVKKRAHSDPVTLGARAGLYVPVTIDTQAAPGDAGFRTALTTRGQQAMAAQRHYRGAAAPFMPEEASALKQRWADAGEQERFDIIQAFSETMPPAARDAALEQVGAGNAERIAAQFSARPDISRAILHGAALLNDKDFDKKSVVVREALRAKLGGEIYPSPAMQHDVETAALAVYAADRGAASLYDPADGGAIEKAIEKVTGALIRRNGRKVPAPPGVTAGNFEDALDAIDQRTLDAQGGAYDRNGRRMDPADVGRRAQLVPLFPGSARYAVLMPTPDGRGAPVLTYDGGPLVLDVDDLMKRQAAGIGSAAAENIARRRAAIAAREAERAAARRQALESGLVVDRRP